MEEKKLYKLVAETQGREAVLARGYEPTELLLQFTDIMNKVEYVVDFDAKEIIKIDFDCVKCVLDEEDHEKN